MAGDTPDVSVVVPVRNGAAFIGAQLDSLSAQQTTCSWELVVADNGSTDGTAELVRRHLINEFVDVRVVDAGPVPSDAHARDVGATAARGHILVFCDADDVTEPGWIEAYWQAMRDLPPSAAAGPIDVRHINPRWLAEWGLSLLEPGVTELGMRHGWGGNMAFHAEAWQSSGHEAAPLTRGFGDLIPFALAQRHGVPFVWVDGPPVHYRLSPRRRTLLRKTFRHGTRLVRFVDAYPDCAYPRPRLVRTVRDITSMALRAVRHLPRNRALSKGLVRSTTFQLGVLTGLVRSGVRSGG